MYVVSIAHRVAESKENHRRTLVEVSGDLHVDMLRMPGLLYIEHPDRYVRNG